MIPIVSSNNIKLGKLQYMALEFVLFLLELVLFLISIKWLCSLDMWNSRLKEISNFRKVHKLCSKIRVTVFSDFPPIK